MGLISRVAESKDEMSRYQKQYILELNSALDSLDNCSSSYDLLAVLVSWLSSNDHIINEFKKLGYDFSKYLIMDAKDYPVEKSLLNGEEIIYFRNNIRRKIASGYFRFTYFVQYLRDTLEHLFIEHIEKTCPSCEWVEMQILEEQDTHQVVYMCTQCGAAFYANNSRFTAEKSLMIPMKAKRSTMPA